MSNGKDMATKNEVERLAKVEEKVDGLRSDITDIKVSVKDLATTLDKKFASKWVERVVAGLIGIILTAFLGILIALVFRQPATGTSVTRTTTVTVNPNGTTTKDVTDSNGNRSETTTPSAAGDTPGTTTTTEETTPQSSGLIGDLLNGLGL